MAHVTRPPSLNKAGFSIDLTVLVFQERHNSIISDDHLSQVWAAEFGNDAIDKCNCMEDRVAGDTVFDILEIVPGWSATNGLAPSGHSFFQLFVGKNPTLGYILKAFLHLLFEE